MNPPDLTMTSKLKSTTGPAAVDIRSFQPGTADAKAFRSLNEEWITKFFTMEARDSRYWVIPRPRSSNTVAIFIWLTWGWRPWVVLRWNG